MYRKFYARAILVTCLSGMVFSVFASPRRLDLLGDPAPVMQGNRTIQVDPGVKHISVETGETINFVVGDKTFAWSFNAPLGADFDLRQIAPVGSLQHSVYVHAAPDPLYVGF
jgi:hypothetical protein